MTAAAKSWLMAAVGGVVGTAGAVVLLPWLRQVDPLGLSPVVLIAFGGGLALGWYIRGTGPQPTETDIPPGPAGG